MESQPHIIIIKEVIPLKKILLLYMWKRCHGNFLETKHLLSHHFGITITLKEL